MYTRRNRAFTLIEILVVIAIIGILAAIILASLSTARARGADAKVQEQLVGLRNSAEIYFGGKSIFWKPRFIFLVKKIQIELAVLFCIEK